MIVVELLGLLAGGLVSFGFTERVFHQRNLNKIPTRIHVSGTRGKSSVTRLLATGLSKCGVPAAAKTTGTMARMILPDQREFPVYRPTGANIIEQKRIISAAAQMGVESLVLECMALQPLFHWISEDKLVRATHGVITNVRADHLDVMGPEEEDVAKAIAGMIPVKGVLYTAERKHLGILEDAALDRKTRVVAISEEEVNAITEQDMSGFKYSEHAENVALVLRIMADFGIERDRALAGIKHTNPDPGALCECKLEYFGRTLHFVNGFAANDPESTKRIWDYATAKYKDVDRVVAVFNMRADRPSRSLQMARESDFWKSAEKVVLIGTGSYLFAKLSTNEGVDAQKFLTVESDRMSDIFESILESCARRTLVIGMGNIGGPGLGLVQYFKNRSIPEEWQ